MANWVPIAKISDLTPDSVRVVRAGNVDIALGMTSDGLFAMDNVCPHSGGSLGEGLVQDNVVTCPLHAWQFECKTGKCLTEKRAPQHLYPLKLEKDQVLVDLPEAIPAPAPAARDGVKVADGDWFEVAEASSLRPGTVKRVKAGETILALVCSTEGVFAMDRTCPHEGGPMDEGSLDGTTITCPVHGYKFDCKSGACQTEARFKIRTYETKVEKGKVWARVQKAPETVIAPADDPANKKSQAEIWKTAKNGIDSWPDMLRFAQEGTPMSKIETADLERMKWYGFFYRKNNDNDHYMIRIRIPGSEMTFDQARAIAFVAYESGYSIVDVTTRCNVQIQGLTIDKLPGVRAAIEKVGLTARQTGHDNIRNAFSHPYSGIDPEELVDTREMCREMTDMIVGSREFSDLPRKFNVAMTGRTDPAGHFWTQDLSFVATWGTEGKVGFQLLLGGTQGQSPKIAAHFPVYVKPEQVLDVTAAVIRTFRELGYRHNRNQVRFRYLIERIGADQVLVEIEKRLGYPLIRFSKAPAKPLKEENFVGWFKQKQHDLWALGVCVPLGRLTWDQFEGMALVSQQYGWGTLRTTYNQNLVIPGVPTAAKQAVGYAVARYGLTFEPDSVTKNVVSCTGKQFCNLAVTETKGYAFKLIEELRRRKVQLHGINLNMSGCPSSCGMSHTADIGLKGGKIRKGLRVVDAFDVYLGGGLADDVKMGVLYKKLVPVDQLPDFIEKVISEFYQNRTNGETFSQYWRDKLKGHTAEPQTGEIPKWTCSRCGHLHVGQDPPRFCPVCAALRAMFEPAPTEPAGEPARPKAAAREASPSSSPVAPTAHAVAPSAPSNGNGSGEKTSSNGTLWICKSCGLKHPAAEPPELCPVCGAQKCEFQFKRSATPLVTAKAKPTGKKILIVGGSIGGHTAAQTVRSLDPSAQITLLTNEHHSFYNRLNLTRFLSQEVQNHELFDYSPAWYEENQIQVLTKTEVIGMDPIKKTALLKEGRELAYDSCILTHGSSANTPPFYRSDLPGVYLLRTLDDVENIISRSKPGTKVVVIGGGVLGLEAAYGLVKRGASVKVFEFFPYLMPRQLDKASGALFEQLVREKMIEPYVGVGVKELLGTDHVKGLKLADGRSFDADLVVVSTGIKANIDWVKRSGINCNRGVVVDDRMQTSADGVFAAGDVAEWREQVIGLWTNAVEQAKVAAANAVGKMAFFQGFLPVTILKCIGIPLVSIGEIKEDGKEISSKIKHDPKARTYRRVVLRNGIPIGGILLGTTAGMGEMRKLIEDGQQLEKLRQKVVPDEELAPV